MRVEHELLCHTGVEGLVALGCIVERDDGCIDDLCDGKPVVQDGLHELAVVLEDGRLAGVEGVIISNTGYTGAGGFELYMMNADAKKVWDAVFQGGDAGEHAGVGREGDGFGGGAGPECEAGDW